MKKIEDLRILFQNPGSEYKTAPLWVWNADMTEEEIEKSLTELHNNGFGGAFVHPRPGMKITYLSDEFFYAWGKALETAKKLGMKLNIYDENSYPSGFGGGHVSAELPDCLSEAMRYKVYSAEEMNFEDEEIDWLSTDEIVKVYACEHSEKGMVFREDLTLLPRSMWKGKGTHYAVVTHLNSQTAGWLAGFADVDRLRPEVTETFLEKVYEKYAQNFQSDFGDTIQAIFTDEPSLPGSTVYGRGGEDSVPVNHWFLYEFQKRKGYDLIEYLPCLFEDWEGCSNEKIRHDYYECVLEIWTENFLIPIQKWCHEHNIAFTGHFMEDGWPKPYYCVVAPCVMSNYEYQDWPGIDLLLTDRLKNCSSEDQEISMIEVMSAAHQFGKDRVFCEAFGAGGYDSGLADYKRIADYLFVNGVNFINEHLTYTSYAGARKRDHPQSFDWRQPWWKEFGALNDYFGRVSALLSEGKSEERILVLNPTVTGFISPKNEDMSQLVFGEMAKQPDTRAFLELIHQLRAEQWDINLGDEYIIQRHGKVNDGKLEIVEQKYDVVILHGCIENMLRSTADILERFMEQGGQVISVGKAGDFINGEHCPELYDHIYANKNCTVFENGNTLLKYLNDNCSKYFTYQEKLPVGVESIRKVLDDGTEVYFITNHSKEDINTEICFNTNGLEEWNPWTMEMCLTGVKKDSVHVETKLDLKDGESKIFVCTKQHNDLLEEVALNVTINKARAGEITPEEIKIESKNTLPLEYCDIEIDGDVYCNYSTIAAGNIVYQKRGFGVNPWDNVVQYKDHTYRRNKFYTENSGFSVKYYFEVERSYQAQQLELAVEYGTRYKVLINGILLNEKKDEYYIDHLTNVYDISQAVKAGKNEVKLVADKFDVELEVEPVILLGDFGVHQENNRWMIGKADTLKMGSIVKQGYPFYAGAVLYESTIEYSGKEKVMLFISELEATAISVSVNDMQHFVANINGHKEIAISDYLKEGKNKICIRLCTSMKNLLGPHFDPSHPRNTAWPDMWKRAPKVGEPCAQEYDLIDYGLKQIVVKRLMKE